MLTIKQRSVLFGLYCVSVAVTNADAVHALVDIASRDMTASHVVIIPFITAGLFFADRRAIFSSAGWCWRALPFALVMWFCLLVRHLLPWATHSSMTTVGLIVLVWILGFVTVFGTEAFRAARFPILFLALTNPIPPQILHVVTQILKQGSAATVDAIFMIAGTPHYREGFVYALPTFTIEIADECSGIRSTIALLITSLLMGQFFLSRAWQRIVLAAVIVPITILKNGVRIASLCLLAIHYDPGFLSGRLHHEGGIFFFVLGVAILMPVLALLHRVEIVRSGDLGLS